MDVDSVTLESFLELNFPSELNFATPIEYPSFNTPDAVLQTTAPTTITQEPPTSSLTSSVLAFQMTQPVQTMDVVSGAVSSTATPALSSPPVVQSSSGRPQRSCRLNPDYNLRPRSVQIRIETEQRRKQQQQQPQQRAHKREPKPKQKPPPLSKYRRKTANARERCRMQEINRAFEELRAAVPALPPDCVPDKNGDSSKLTKITTLRLAVNYIAALSRMLREANESEENSSEVDSVQSIDSLESSLDFGDDPLLMGTDLVGMILESDGESLQLSDAPTP
nr:neurogenin-3-like [Rhipicephalus microplus]